jgi:hypothetical protein
MNLERVDGSLNLLVICTIKIEQFDIMKSTIEWRSGHFSKLQLFRQGVAHSFNFSCRMV